jgi:hypothetical protein
MDTASIKHSINFANVDVNGQPYSFTITRNQGETFIQAAQRMIKNTQVLESVVAYLTYVDNGNKNV